MVHRLRIVQRDVCAQIQRNATREVRARLRPIRGNHMTTTDDQNFQAFVVFELDGTPVGVFATEEQAKQFIADTADERGPYLAFLETPILGVN
jgi:hypothetical protein